MVDAFLRSDVAKTIEDRLGKGELSLSDKDAAGDIRNYLMLRILITNGQRSGALKGLTPRVLSKATPNAEGATIMVWNIRESVILKL